MSGFVDPPRKEEADCFPNLYNPVNTSSKMIGKPFQMGVVRVVAEGKEEEGVEGVEGGQVERPGSGGYDGEASQRGRAGAGCQAGERGDIG